MMIAALESAQLYEFSRIDAGICDGDPQEMKYTKSIMAAYSKKEKQLRKKTGYE